MARRVDKIRQRGIESQHNDKVRAVSQADVANMVLVNLLEEFAVKSLHKKEISLVDNSYFSTTKN